MERDTGRKRERKTLSEREGEIERGINESDFFKECMRGRAEERE